MLIWPKPYLLDVTPAWAQLVSYGEVPAALAALVAVLVGEAAAGCR